MAEIHFIYEGNTILIQSNMNQIMKDICTRFCLKINKDINSLIFLYGGDTLNLEKTLNEITEEKEISILVYRNEREICSKCGKILDDKKIDEIISLNNSVKDTLEGLFSQIENIIIDIINKKESKYINNQLKNMNIILNKTIEDIKIMNNKLNTSKSNNIKTSYLKTNEINPNKINKIDQINNEIICVYNKQDDEISLIHDYSKIDNLLPEFKKFYLDGKNNLNENNLDIYINDKKIKFNYNYKSSEKGNIKVKFKFNKLITSINHIFWGCTSLEHIDFSLFNSSNIINMSCMAYNCSSLKSINFSSINTSNVYNMSFMFYDCKFLKSLDLSSFNTNKVRDMKGMFAYCSSLESIDLSSFNTNNVESISGMFTYCSSLKSIDLSSFNTNKVEDMSGLFTYCSSLKFIDLSSFNITNVNNINYMFAECPSLISLDLSSFITTTNLKNMKNIFKGCKCLKKNNIKINKSEIEILSQIDN